MELLVVVNPFAIGDCSLSISYVILVCATRDMDIIMSYLVLGLSSLLSFSCAYVQDNRRPRQLDLSAIRSLSLFLL